MIYWLSFLFIFLPLGEQGKLSGCIICIHVIEAETVLEYKKIVMDAGGVYVGEWLEILCNCRNIIILTHLCPVILSHALSYRILIQILGGMQPGFPITIP